MKNSGEEAFRFKPAFVIFLFGMAIGVLSCGGGGGGGGNPFSGGFTPDQASPGPDTISLVGVTGGPDLDLIIRSNGISSNVLGAAFDLTFDADVVTYLGYSPGDLFEKAGPVTYAVYRRNDRLIVGATVAGPGAGGAGSVVTLHFRAAGTGSSAIRFENHSLCSSASTTTCDRQPSIPWYGGLYVVQ